MTVLFEKFATKRGLDSQRGTALGRNGNTDA